MIETKRVQEVVLIKNIHKFFLGFHPKECIRKLIQFLLDNNYCYILTDYTQLKPESRGKVKPKRLNNYIFAHNGFGFDYKFMYEELHSTMREFSIVGDITQTKQLRGNGLFFFDFSLIYKEKLKDLAKTFFPNDKDMHKLECDLVIGLERETLKGWYDTCKEQNISPYKHPQLKLIIDYCMQDSYSLLAIVNKFFETAYTTPFGHSFLPQMFYHSLSAMGYSMFVNCYLKVPLFVNKHSLGIELDTKLGGCTGSNSNIFGIGVFIDENSFYPSVMKNEMPARYEESINDPYIVFDEPLLIDGSNYCGEEAIVPINIYRVTYRFPEGTALPTICERTFDTLVMVLESEDFDECVDHKDAKTVYLYGYAIIAAIEEIPGTKFRVFGTIRFKRGDFIFKDFIEDQYNLRLAAKRRGDDVGDKFHKNIMNSAQGKLGQKLYTNVKFGGAQCIRDYAKQLGLQDHVNDIVIRQILSDNVDLFELRWTCNDDQWMSQGNTVRLPAYIMSVARTQLLRIQNAIARAYGNPDVIAYYDTDSILTRFDLTNRRMNDRVQVLFDAYLSYQTSAKSNDNMIGRCIAQHIKERVTQVIGDLIDSTKEMKILKEISIQDVTMLHEDKKDLLLDELRLGACKIEKYVIRGIALGAKQYGVYFLEWSSKAKSWQMRVAVKLKGVRADARTMSILEDISGKIQHTVTEGPVAQGELPFALTNLMTKWSRMGAGTILSDMVKIVRPTLTKRAHNLVDGTSVPFKTVADFQASKNIYEARAKELKDQFKGGIEQLLEDIKVRPEFIALQEASKLANSLATASKIFFKDAL